MLSIDLAAGSLLAGYFFKDLFIGHHNEDFWLSSIFFVETMSHQEIPLWLLIITPVLVISAIPISYYYFIKDCVACISTSFTLFILITRTKGRVWWGTFSFINKSNLSNCCLSVCSKFYTTLVTLFNKFGLLCLLFIHMRCIFCSI